MLDFKRTPFKSFTIGDDIIATIEAVNDKQVTLSVSFPSKALTLSLIELTPQQSFKIGDDITIIISAVSGNQVALSVDAPKEMKILRDDAIQKEKVVAA